MAGRADGLDHLEDALAHAALADLVVGAHQLERLALDQRILLLLERRGRLAEPPLRPRPDIGRPASAFEGISSKKYDTGTSSTLANSNRRLEPMRLEPRSYFWICWKVRPTAVAELLLAHAEKRAALAHPRANMDINRM